MAEDDLAEACSRAPKFGMNAKALILQAALAADDEPAPQRPDATAEAAAAIARRGAEYLAAVDVKQRPLAAYVPRSKVPRINRQTVLAKLAGEHLALAAATRCPLLGPAAAAADLELRKAAFAAALAQELELFGRCSSAVVYQNLAARTSATQWPQPGGVDASQPPPPQQQQQVEQQPEPEPAGQRTGVQPPARPGQQGKQEEGSEADGQQARPAKRARASGSAEGKHVAGLSSRPVLQECDLDWEAAPAAEAEAQAGAQPSPEARGSKQPKLQTAAAAPRSAQTELGSLQLEPLAPLPTLAPLGATAAAAAAAPGSAADPATRAEARTPDAAPEPAPAGAPAAAPAGDAAAVRQQVELFVRAELHPLLKRHQISQALHDAVCERCTAKVMACHAGAAAADFLVREAASIRALVKQYVQHMQQQRQQ